MAKKPKDPPVPLASPRRPVKKKKKRSTAQKRVARSAGGLPLADGRTLAEPPTKRPPIMGVRQDPAPIGSGSVGQANTPEAPAEFHRDAQYQRRAAPFGLAPGHQSTVGPGSYDRAGNIDTPLSRDVAQQQRRAGVGQAVRGMQGVVREIVKLASDPMQHGPGGVAAAMSIPSKVKGVARAVGPGRKAVTGARSVAEGQQLAKAKGTLPKRKPREIPRMNSPEGHVTGALLKAGSETPAKGSRRIRKAVETRNKAHAFHEETLRTSVGKNPQRTPSPNPRKVYNKPKVKDLGPANASMKGEPPFGPPLVWDKAKKQWVADPKAKVGWSKKPKRGKTIPKKRAKISGGPPLTKKPVRKVKSRRGPKTTPRDDIKDHKAKVKKRNADKATEELRAKYGELGKGRGKNPTGRVTIQDMAHPRKDPTTFNGDDLLIIQKYNPKMFDRLMRDFPQLRAKLPKRGLSTIKGSKPRKRSYQKPRKSKGAKVPKAAQQASHEEIADLALESIVGHYAKKTGKLPRGLTDQTMQGKRRGLKSVTKKKSSKAQPSKKKPPRKKR